MSTRKILQIIPATGWRVLYENPDGSLKQESLVCFALAETEENGKLETKVLAMESMYAEAVFCEDNPGVEILRLLAPGEEE